MIGDKVKHYEITAQLGAGGMGEVYLATDTKLGRQVALKFLPREFANDPDRRKRLELEAMSVSSLDHPNIMTIYEIDEHEGRPFIAMAYVDGKTLRDRIDDGNLSLETAVRFGIQLAAALAAAHTQGIVHRDLKPANVMIGTDNRVRLTDFGLAKLKESSGLTTEGTTVGTVGYMSPEQAQGMAVDSRSDVFSLGVILYEMLCGTRPFTAEHAAAALYSIVHENPRPLRDCNQSIPPELAAIVDKALSKDPRDRYDDGAAIETELRQLGRTLEISRISSGQHAVVRRSQRQRLTWAVAGLAAILIGLAGAALGLIPDVLTPDSPDVHANENTLAVMQFDNLSNPDDPNRLGDIITELLTTDLSGSNFVTVVSSQRLYDLIKRETGTTNNIDQGVALRVAQKSGANRMLAGSISKLGDRTIITAQIVDVTNGQVVGSERVDGDDVFAMVDDLSVRVKRRLGLSDSEVMAGDMPVAQATTNNPDAYRAYVEGMNAYHALDWKDAHEHFDEALALDSGFALAYLRKGIAYFSDGQQALGFEAMAKVRQYQDRATGFDHLLVQAMAVDWADHLDMEKAQETLKRATIEYPTHKEAFFWVANFALGRNQLDTAIVYSGRALELDPEYPFAMLIRATALTEKGQYDDARRLAEHYRTLRPNDVSPYEMIGDIFRRVHQFDSARVAYAQAIEIAPDQRDGYLKLGRLFLLMGEPDSAISWFTEMMKTDNSFTRNIALRHIAAVHKLYGRFDESLRYLQWADALADSAHLDNVRAATHRSIANLYLDTDRLDEAARFCRMTADYDTINPSGLYLEANIHAIRGQPERATNLVDSLNQVWEGRFDSDALEASNHTVAAHNAVSAGQYQVAIDEFLASRDLLHDTTNDAVYLAEAYMLAGQPREAIRELTAYQAESETNWLAGNYVRSLYLLADAYVQVDQPDSAHEALKRLMVFWGEAEWDVPWMRDAKRLYGSLSAQ